jgi:hypothetical protein
MVSGLRGPLSENQKRPSTYMPGLHGLRVLELFFPLNLPRLHLAGQIWLHAVFTI